MTTLTQALATPEVRERLTAHTVTLTADGARLVSDSTGALWFRCEGRRMVKVMDMNIEVTIEKAKRGNV